MRFRLLTARAWRWLAILAVAAALVVPLVLDALRASRPAVVAGRHLATVDHPWSRLP